MFAPSEMFLVVQKKKPKTVRPFEKPKLGCGVSVVEPHFWEVFKSVV